MGFTLSVIFDDTFSHADVPYGGERHTQLTNPVGEDINLPQKKIIDK